VKAHTLSCSHSFCERCITSWLKKNQECPTCRKIIEGKPIYSIALDNAIGKLVELRVESFAEQLRSDISGAKSLANHSNCGTQTTLPNESRDSRQSSNGSKNGGACIRHFIYPKNGVSCHVINFYDAPCDDYDEYDDDDYDDYDDDEYDGDDNYYEDYNGLPGYYWGGYGVCFNCGMLV